MKSMIGALVVGLLLFGVSAGVSTLYIFPPAEEVAEEMTDEAGDLERPGELPLAISNSEKVEIMPVGLRPEIPVSVEAVTELAQSIMKKENAVIDAEMRLKKEEKRIQLLFEDLERERDEMTAFGQRIDAKIVEAREAVELLKLENQSLMDQSKKLSSLEKKTGRTSADTETDEVNRRVEVVKNWFQNLEAEQAANYLKEFANRGDIQFAARLLNSLEKRQIAKILAAFDDAPLVAQIIDAYTKSDSAVSKTTAQ